MPRLSGYPPTGGRRGRRRRRRPPRPPCGRAGDLMNEMVEPLEPTGARRALRWAGAFATVACLILAAILLIPAALGFQRYVIVSGSMTGTYDRGSIVYDKEMPVSDL